MFLVKSLHIVFVVSWFSGLFYLPRIFVNLAAVPADSTAERERLLGMARRLLRFMSILALLAIAFGLWLWWGFGITGSWLYVKIVLVLALIAYHLSCDVLLDGFVRNRNRRSERWFRIYNEVPLLLLLMIVILVVLKPF
ncbi:MAG: CopD family protein [Burkholderiaceae bacterium]|nr:CopD family protein [Burkholderiaceae bacterium]